MSGFEAAGIALGVFPLAISSLKGFREFATAWNFFHEIRTEYNKSLRELRTLEITFTLSLRKLIQPLAEQGQVDRLLKDPGSDLWTNGSFAEALKVRLHDAYPHYLETIDLIKITMKEVYDEMGMDIEGFQTKIRQKEVNDPTQSAPSPEPSNPFNKQNREYQKYRIKFSIRESKRERLFKQLGKHIDQLEKLLSISSEVAKLQKSTNIAAKSVAASFVSSAMCKSWVSAVRLYRALSAAWKCDCIEQHYAHFLLQHRTTAMKDFRLVLLPLASHENGQWTSRHLKIEMKEDPAVRICKLENPKTTGSSTRAEKMAPMDPYGAPEGSANRKGKGKSVSIAASTFINQGLPLITIKVESPSVTPSTHEDQVEQELITSLCETMTFKEGPKCVGYFRDEHRRYYLYPSLNKSKNYSIAPVTLGDLLLGSLGPTLELGQRVTLALILASSFLQLQGSPWLVSPWGKSSIYFPRDADQADLILLDQISVARGFSETAASSNVEESHEAGALIKIQELDSLAVLLLELCFSCSLEERRQKRLIEDEQTRTDSDFVAASQWYTEVNTQAGEDYADAVKWCLEKCQVPQSSGGWRREMIDKVLKPLERSRQSLA